MLAIRTFAAWLVLANLGCTSLGLRSSTETARPQANDDPAEKLAAARVGDKTVVGNVDPLPVSAVGLVWKLNGTGSNASGEWRAVLERDLRKKKLPNVSQYLDDPNHTTSLVLVSAVIPPGVKKGDTIDVDVSLPRGSSTTSLKGGVLLECDLATTAESGNVRDAMIKSGAEVGAQPVMGNTMLIGRTLVRAEGPLVVGTDSTTAKMKASVEDADPTEGYTVGRIWGGGRVLEGRTYYFVLNNKNSRVAMEIAERLNATFNVGGDSRNKTAKAVNDSVVSVSVPAAYRLNHTRFLIVARQVPMLPAGPDSLYRKRLEAELLEPATCINAAIKLEAARRRKPTTATGRHAEPIAVGALCGRGGPRLSRQHRRHRRTRQARRTERRPPHALPPGAGDARRWRQLRPPGRTHGPPGCAGPLRRFHRASQCQRATCGTQRQIREEDLLGASGGARQPAAGPPGQPYAG